MSAKLDERHVYFIGSWRRSEFDPNIMPQSLNVDENANCLRLASFDSEFNNLFRFHVGGDARFVLQLVNPSQTLVKKLKSNSVFVTSMLSLTSEKSKAAMWQLSAYEPFRNGPMDVSFQVRLAETGAMLCSSEKTGKVSLIEESSQAHSEINIAWEATPDCDQAVPGGDVLVPEWLQEMMTA